jgi:hypothetical protein
MQGFNILAWTMPFIGIAIGLAAIALWIRRFRKPKQALQPVEVAVDDRYQKRIEQEMADLD